MIGLFWKRIYNLSRKKIKKHHLQQFGSDIKCPNCNEWFSITAINYKHEHVSEPTWGFHVKCGQCTHESFWNAEIAPVLISCDRNGNPI